MTKPLISPLHSLLFVTSETMSSCMSAYTLYLLTYRYQHVRSVIRGEHQVPVGRIWFAQINRITVLGVWTMCILTKKLGFASSDATVKGVSLYWQITTNYNKLCQLKQDSHSFTLCYAVLLAIRKHANGV